MLERCGVGMAFIATLAVDDETVAAQLCLARHRRAYSVVPAMDPLRKDIAPGRALLRHLAQDLATAGCEHLDLGRTAPGQHACKTQYQPRWSESVRAVSAPMTCPEIPDERTRPTAEALRGMYPALRPGGASVTARTNASHNGVSSCCATG